MKQPHSTYSEDGKIVTFHAGKFHYTAEDSKVTVSRTGLSPIDVEVVAFYEYKDNDEAIDCAYKMALKQANY